MFSVFDDDMFSMYLQQLAFKIEQAKKKHKYFFLQPNCVTIEDFYTLMHSDIDLLSHIWKRMLRNVTKNVCVRISYKVHDPLRKSFHLSWKMKQFATFKRLKGSFQDEQTI